MGPIYAVSIVASESSIGPTVRATVSVHQDGQAVAADLEWRLQGAIMTDLSATEWLYTVLERVVSEYDDHTVSEARQRPWASASEEAKSEA